MKTILLLCIFSFAGLSLGEKGLYPRGCVYIDGECSRECEVGTYSYSTGCDYLLPEATCEEPNPVKDTRGQICDFSACYCNPPTVRNTETKQCVPLDECPEKTLPCE